MLSSPSSDSESDSEFDDDASISITTYDSDTFSQLDAEREARIQSLQEQEVAQGIRIAQLEAALAAAHLQISEQTQRDRVAEVEAAERQLAEERRIREIAEQAVNEAREASARSEALRVTAELQLLAQQQLEIQRQAERQRAAEEAARQAAAQLPISQQPFEEQVRRVIAQPALFNGLTVQQQQVVVTQLSPQQKKDAAVANLLLRMGRK